jgi:hypothetical protein
MGRILLVVTLGLGVVLGCTPPPLPPPPTTPELTTEQIVAEIQQALTPMTSLVEPVGNTVGWGADGAGAPALLTDEAKAQVIAYLRSANEKYQGTENGKAALVQIRNDIVEMLQKARDQERWRLVMAGVEIYEMLNPGSTKMDRLKERAQVHLNRPEVVVKGFLEDKQKNDIYAFLDVKLHPSNEVHKVQVRKGEEFFGLRLVDIIGNMKGVILEYLLIPGETFRLRGP